MEYGFRLGRSKLKNANLRVRRVERKAYHSAKLYKERIKRWHDKRIKKKEFNPRDKVLLFNSRV
jgi:hypothetical protein